MLHWIHPLIASVASIILHKNKKMNKNHIVLSGNTAWGMWNFRSALVKHFLKCGHKVSISAPFDEIYFKKFRDIGCHVYDIPINPKGINPVEDYRLVLKYKKLFKMIKPDFSITYTIKPNIYASVAAHSLGIKFLPVTTGLGYTFLTKGLIPAVARQLYKFSFRKAEEVWFLNDDDIATFRKAKLIAKEKVVQLPGEGVDLEHFAYENTLDASSTTKFLLVGRMLKDKGVVEYVEAARILKNKYPKVHFQLLGAIWEGNPAAIKKTQIDKWVEEGIVDYLGQTSDVRKFVKDASCVVLPSYREGVPCTLMEGAAIGKPLVATDVPGCRDVVKDGYNGYLCKVKDSRDLASKMEKMITDGFEHRLQMGKNGRLLMEEKFDVNLIIKQYDDMLKKFLLGL